jgi:hypothetical protein
VAATQEAASAPATQIAAQPSTEDQVPDDEAAPEAGQPAPKAPAAKPAPMVPVKLVSIPPGASVRIARRSFGVTPRSLHFRAGLTYQLIFEKQGYVPVRRLVRVSPRGGQTVKVAMRKGKWKGWLPW